MSKNNTSTTKDANDYTVVSLINKESIPTYRRGKSTAASSQKTFYYVSSSRVSLDSKDISKLSRIQKSRSLRHLPVLKYQSVEAIDKKLQRLKRKQNMANMRKTQDSSSGGFRKKNNSVGYQEGFSSHLRLSSNLSSMKRAEVIKKMMEGKAPIFTVEGRVPLNKLDTERMFQRGRKKVMSRVFNNTTNGFNVSSQVQSKVAASRQSQRSVAEAREGSFPIIEGDIDENSLVFDMTQPMITRRIQESMMDQKQRTILEEQGQEDDGSSSQATSIGWSARGPNNLRIRLRKRLTFKNNAQGTFLGHLNQVRKLYDDFDYKLKKKINVYNIPEGVTPQFSDFSEYYKTDLQKYEDTYKKYYRKIIGDQKLRLYLGIEDESENNPNSSRLLRMLEEERQATANDKIENSVSFQSGPVPDRVFLKGLERSIATQNYWGSGKGEMGSDHSFISSVYNATPREEYNAEQDKKNKVFLEPIKSVKNRIKRPSSASQDLGQKRQSVVKEEEYDEEGEGEEEQVEKKQTMFEMQRNLIMRKKSASINKDKNTPSRSKKGKVQRKRRPRPNLLGSGSTLPSGNKKKRKKRKPKKGSKYKIESSSKTKTRSVKLSIPDVLRNPELDTETLGKRLNRRQRLMTKTVVRKTRRVFNKAKKEKYKRVMKKDRRIPFHKFTFRPKFVEVDDNFPFSFIVDYSGPIGMANYSTEHRDGHYKSYWLAKIDRILKTSDFQESSEIGYYRLFKDSSYLINISPHPLPHLKEKHRKVAPVLTLMERKLFHDLIYEGKEILEFGDEIDDMIKTQKQEDYLFEDDEYYDLVEEFLERNQVLKEKNEMRRKEAIKKRRRIQRKRSRVMDIGMRPVMMKPTASMFQSFKDSGMTQEDLIKEAGKIHFSHILNINS